MSHLTMRMPSTTVNQGRIDMVYNWLNTVRSTLFPSQCRLCLAPAKDQTDLCKGCLRELPWSISTCSRCALPIPEGAEVDICARCQQAPPPLDRCDALFHYQAPVDGWIQQLKFHEDLSAAQLLGELLASKIRLPPEDFYLLPVPLHKKRLRQRGFNQALEISRPLLQSGIKPLTIKVRRKNITAAQSSLKREARKKNLHGAFSVQGTLDQKSVLIIDDVMTTGATLNELALQLRYAGAKRIYAWVVARTGMY